MTALRLFIDNAFPPESNIFPSKCVQAMYGPAGLAFNASDDRAKEALKGIAACYAEMRRMNDEYEIAMIKQRIAELKQERMDYLEYCWLHCRYRRT